MKRCLIFVLILLLAGCGMEERKWEKATQEKAASLGKRISQEVGNIVAWNDGDEAEYQVDESVDGRTADLTDYSAFLRKIWHSEEWVNRTVPPAVSLVITRIEGGYIEGYFDIDQYLKADYFNLVGTEDERTSDKMYGFQGMIYDGTVECECAHREGRTVTLAITFCEDGGIEVELNGDDMQRYRLRPYHISDQRLRKEQTSYEVEIDSWGVVTLLYANREDRKSIPYVAMLDDNGNILYEFQAGYLVDSEVKEVIVEDVNGDGLKDVKVVTYYPESDNDFEQEWYFFQREDGMFYMGWVCWPGEEVQDMGEPYYIWKRFEGAE